VSELREGDESPSVQNLNFALRPRLKCRIALQAVRLDETPPSDAKVARGPVFYFQQHGVGIARRRIRTDPPNHLPQLTGRSNPDPL